MAATPERTVKETGASPGDMLIGIKDHNRDLRVRIAKRQEPGDGGRIKGSFTILNGGTGEYSKGIEAVIGKNEEFKTAAEFIDRVALEKDCQKCTHILNANSLRKLE